MPMLMWKAFIGLKLYNLTHFSSRNDFLAKAESYRQYYNLIRPNFSKRGKTPWLIAQEDHPNNDLATIAEFIGVIDLEKEISRTTAGGQTLPVLPGVEERQLRSA